MPPPTLATTSARGSCRRTAGSAPASTELPTGARHAKPEQAPFPARGRRPAGRRARSPLLGPRPHRLRGAHPSLGLEGLHGANPRQRETRRVTIGRHGVWTPERAHREAGSLLASLKAGETPRWPGVEPSANEPTIAERYMTGHVAVRCKPTTQRGCRHILDRFPAAALRGDSPERGHARPRVAAAPAARQAVIANQAVSLLSRLFYSAAKSGEAPAGGNPCRFIQKYPTRG